MTSRRLENRTALVTGAGSGLGLATAHRMALEGAAVICADRDRVTAEHTAKLIADFGGRAAAATIDVTDPEGLERVVSTAMRAFGSLDILVANAGIAVAGTAIDTSIADWDRTIAVNLTGVWLSIRAALPVMVEQHGGSIITTASVAGVAGRPGIAAYSAAKGGVVALTRQVALDYAPYGIRANALCPGLAVTPLSEGASEALGGGIEAGRQRLHTAASTIPLGRLGLPEDVAAVAAFLASDDAGYITGTVQIVDGGMTLGTLR